MVWYRLKESRMICTARQIPFLLPGGNLTCCHAFVPKTVIDSQKGKHILTPNSSCAHRLSLAILTAVCLGLSAGLVNAKSGAGAYLKNSDQWFAGDEARRIAANILSYQSDLGGWPKNTDTTSKPFRGDRQKNLRPTFDNSATTDELRFLARIYGATAAERYREAFGKGYDYILKAQYPNGGWPQFYPPPRTYHRHITFNDDAMVRLMEFLRETYRSNVYAFLDPPRKQAARAAFDRGVACILKCQIKVGGKRMVWCAQHDEQDYTPKTGRTYELPSLSGAESVGIVRLLMSLDDPSSEVVRAVEGAAAWFESAKLKGIRVVREKDAKAPKGTNKAVVNDPAAQPLWARFYEIGTNRPLYVDRDGVPKYNLADIGYERRNGYAWLGDWPQRLLEQAYPAWEKKWADRIRQP
jgi:PelA/Pel-15E family pectate lyase